MESYLPYWVAASYLEKINLRRVWEWVRSFSDIKALFEASWDELRELGLSFEEIEQVKHPKWGCVERDLAWMQKRDHYILCAGSEDYPALLKEISDPPFILYVRGNKGALLQTQIALVGSRRASDAGLQNAKQFAFCLAEEGFAITSGLALGVDGASHRGALAAKGTTIGVAGTGLHHVYPRAHARLYEDILDQEGVIVSELPLDTGVRAFNFPRRNRIIGGLSIGVLVVEAALKSGSLITARHALEQGREVFAIPGSIHQPLARGCHHLIREGAKLVETAEHIIEELSVHLSAIKKKKKVAQISLPLVNLSTEAQYLLTQIEYEITPYDVILLRSGLTAGEVSSMLLTLELTGYIQSVSGGYKRVVGF